MDHATPGGARGPRGWPAAPDALAADGLSDVTPAHTDAPWTTAEAVICQLNRGG